MSTPHIDEAKAILGGVEFVDEPARLAACVVVSIALQKARAEITRLSGEVARLKGATPRAEALTLAAPELAQHLGWALDMLESFGGLIGSVQDDVAEARALLASIPKADG